MLAEVQSAVARRPADAVLTLLCDFDGTLTEFDPDPAAPVLAPQRRDWLDRLGRRAGCAVGIVSGRRVADLRARTGLASSAYLAGLHGLEIEVGGRRWSHPDLDRAAGLVSGLGSCLEKVAAAWPGALVEDKLVSLAFHVRAVATASRSPALVEADLAARTWLAAGRVRRLDGDCVVEYLPAIAGHKGDALQWIVRDVEARARGPAWVVYLGDDLTDEDAFRAISSGIGVLVGLRPTAATHKLDGVAGVDRFLSWLVSGE